MPTHIIVCLMVVLSLFGSSVQDLHKKTLFPGLSGLDFSFLKVSQQSNSTGGDKTLCQCNGAQPQSVQTITYYGSYNQSIVLCMCPNAVMNSSYMSNTMGKVPYAVRLNDKGMNSATTGTCGGAGSSGDVIVFCDPDMAVTVFIHESSHSFDKGKSASQQWASAVANDTCVPDPYANTNYAEDFAQVVVVWVYLVGHGRDKDFGGSQFACMKNQLQLMSTYLPAGSIKKQ